MLDITHLVVNGCSWTYCQGLDDPKTQGWPALLANRLGVEVVNLAVPGCGNDSIHRRTYEYVYENLPTGSKPFFVIGWSQFWRRETWYNDLFGITGFNDYSIIAMPHDTPTNNAERALLDNWNYLDFYRRTYLYKLSLMNLFEVHKIPYLMSDYSDEHDEEIIKKIRERFPSIVDTVFTNLKQVKPFSRISNNYPKLQCGHDGVESQPVMTSFILSEIARLYGTINVVPGEYLTLKNFKITNSQCKDNTVWR